MKSGKPNRTDEDLGIGMAPGAAAFRPGQSQSGFPAPRGGILKILLALGATAGMAPPAESSEIAQLLSQDAEESFIDEEFGFGGVVAVFQGVPQMERGDFGKLLVAQILPFVVPQRGEGGTGNGDPNMPPIDTKDGINGIAVTGGDGREQMNKSDLNGFRKC